MANDNQPSPIGVERIVSRTVSFRPSAARPAPNPFPNLGLGGTLVTVFVSSYFAAQIVCNVTVLLLYGRHAFFDQGLRVANWKHSILSDGVHLPWYGTLMIGPTILPIVAATLFAAEFLARRLRAFLASRPTWLTAMVRLVGAVALLDFFYRLVAAPQGFPFMHPIPLSTLIGGIVLLWRAAATPFRKPASSPSAQIP
jgi:hypothetical protein